jgi:hypothetical protein
MVNDLLIKGAKIGLWESVGNPSKWGFFVGGKSKVENRISKILDTLIVKLVR